MSLFSDLFPSFFKKKEKTPPQKTPKTRADLEKTFFVKSSLNNAFAKNSTPSADEQKQLKDVFDILESVPEGKKLIADVATAGYKISFDTFRGNSAATCNPVDKQIMLCPANHPNNAAIAASLYHEMTHAMQNERSGGMLADSSKYNIADQVKFLRAAEASAWMEEAKFAYQIKDAHPEVLSHVGNVPMYKAFSAEMEQSKDMNKASQAAFKDWYGYKFYQQGYEDQHIGIVKNKTLNRLKKQDSKAFRESLSSEDALKFTVISDNVKINPEFLTSPEAFSISEDGMKAFAAISKGYASKFMTAKKDDSVLSMYSYDTGKRFSGKEDEKAPAKQPLMSSLNALSQKNVAEKQPMMSSLNAISQKRSAEKQAITAAAQSQSR